MSTKALSTIDDAQPSIPGHWQQRQSRKSVCLSSFQGCVFADWTYVLQYQPLLDATSVKLVPAVQYPNIISSNIILLIND